MCNLLSYFVNNSRFGDILCSSQTKTDYVMLLEIIKMTQRGCKGPLYNIIIARCL
ncbi:hypothetical protein I79_002833 [Cricetulus griseus]|uniref:Uncharacterized protein n=1 Tax=Cricetulus griseus TaxID=10029 RepID=G3GYF7_CRIGR|nr:hypothetical protein I79_002833 [Cricetulus griseus]